MNTYNPKYMIDVYASTFDRTITYGKFISHNITLLFLDGSIFFVRGKSGLHDHKIARIYINKELVFLEQREGKFFEFQLLCDFIYKKTKYSYTVSFSEEEGYQEDLPVLPDGKSAIDLLATNDIFQQGLVKIGYSPTKETTSEIMDLSFKYSFAIGVESTKNDKSFNYITGDNHYTTFTFNTNTFHDTRIENVLDLESKYTDDYEGIPTYYTPWINQLLY